MRQRPVMIGKVQENNIGNGIREMRSLGGLALLTAVTEISPLDPNLNAYARAQHSVYRPRKIRHQSTDAFLRP
jgi:hypothetical protein